MPREHSDQNAEDTPTSSFSHATPRVFNAHAYLQKQIGITAHKALQDIANAGVEQWSAKQIRAQMDNWRAYLRQQGVPQDALDDCAQEVCMHLERTLNDKEGCWVLKAHPDAANELRILSKHADSKQTSLLIVDRTFVVNNERWIVDYKTSCSARKNHKKALSKGKKRSIARSWQHTPTRLLAWAMKKYALLYISPHCPNCTNTNYSARTAGAFI